MIEIKINMEPREYNLMRLVTVLSLGWGLLGISAGAMAAFGTDYFMGLLEGNPDLWMNLMDLTTADTLRNMVMIGGFMLMLSGAFSLVTAISCTVRRNYNTAMISCLASSVCGTFVLVGAMGFAVAYLIRESKDRFDMEETMTSVPETC